MKTTAMHHVVYPKFRAHDNDFHGFVETSGSPLNNKDIHAIHEAGRVKSVEQDMHSKN